MSFIKSIVCMVLMAVVAPSCVSAATNFQMIGSDILPKSRVWVAVSGTSQNGEDSVTFSANSNAGASYQLTIGAQAESEYFFAVDVMSADRVVVSTGGLTMSYHTQGLWQTVCGLVRPDKKGQFDLKIAIASLDPSRTASAELKNFRLQRVDRPKRVLSKPRDGSTILVGSAGAMATIVYPATTSDGRKQAEAIRSAIRTQSGVDLPIISDVEATDTAAPILKSSLKEQNLILIGRLATNRALWSAYNRFLAAEDGYYPGGEGFVIRTAADVFGNGKNHIILGGSTEVGVQKAVDRFIQLPALSSATQTLGLQLPWLLEVQLGAQCLAAFQADELVWKSTDSPMLAAMTPGYGKVVRWYQNAMGYYWSGLDSYRERSQDYLKLLLADRAHTHQYIVEFFIRAMEMLDASPLLTNAEVAQVDSLVLENFLNFLTVTDLSWMTTFSPPYSSIQIVNRHQIAPWYADLIMARFLKRHLELAGELKQLVEFRLSEKDAAFHAFVSSRNGPSMPGIAGSSDYGEFPAVFYRYALENDLYKEFFDSGLARQSLSIERFDHVTARYSFPGCEVDLPDMLGTLAHLTHDGTYRWLAEVVNHPKPERGPFQGRYVADVHHYHIGEDVSAVAPDANWAGIKIVPQPEIADQMEKITMERYPLVSFRGGFASNDDYLAIAGVNPSSPAGTLVRMELNGQSVFSIAGADSDGGMSRITTNGASALNLSDYNPEREKQVPQASSIQWMAELPAAWALQTTTPIAADVSWSRDVVRLERDLYVFADTFTAQRDGKYLLRIAWHGSTLFTPDQDGWKITTNKGSTQISILGDGFLPRLAGASLFSESTRELKKGEAVTVWTVVQGLSRGKAISKAALKGAEQLHLTCDRIPIAVLHKGELETEHGKLVSDLQVVTDQGVCVFGWKENSSDIFKSFFCSEKDSPATDEQAAKREWALAIKSKLSASAQVISASPRSAQFAPDQFNDARLNWIQDWSYGGLLRPARVYPTIKADGIVDFGATVSLAEIRSATTELRTWNTTKIPDDIMYAKNAGGTPQSADAMEWLPLSGEHKDRPGVKTGNYGEIHPLTQVDESLFLQDVHVRYLKSANASKLKYYVNGTPQARHPVRVRVLRDFNEKTGAPLISASTYIFPAFPRVVRDDDFSLSIIKSDGEPLTELNVAGPVQSFLVSDQAGSGHPQIMILRIDGKLESYSLDGKLLTTTDLFEQLVKFDQTYGSPNTRIPTGGQRMPFSFGLWRKNRLGASKMVIGRYGTFSFLDEGRNFEGVLAGGPYANAAILPQGYDFNGDGIEETLVLERYNILQLGGDSKAIVRDPQGFYHWPEVYKIESQKPAKGAETELLAGAPIFEFRVLEKFGGSPRYVLVIRSNYLGVYDAREKQWVYSWAPPGPIQAGALIYESGEEIKVSLATVDGILWNLTWDSRRVSRPIIDIQPLGISINDISASPLGSGASLFSASDGLYLRSGQGVFSRLTGGGFRSADFISGEPGKMDVVAARLNGEVVSFKEVKTP